MTMSDEGDLSKNGRRTSPREKLREWFASKRPKEGSGSLGKPYGGGGWRKVYGNRSRNRNGAIYRRREV